MGDKGISLGTTIMAVQCRDGVVIGADSRTTLGSYVSNRVSDKLTPLHHRIYCCRSGSAADTQAVADVVRHSLSLHAVRTNAAPEVSFAAETARALCYRHRSQLSAGLIVAGWDSKNGGAVYSIPLGGSLHKQSFAIGGSGSSYIYGFCDENFREDMSKEECLSFVTKAVSLAMSRDGSSGGVVRLAVIGAEGVERSVVSGERLAGREVY